MQDRMKPVLALTLGSESLEVVEFVYMGNNVSVCGGVIDMTDLNIGEAGVSYIELIIYGAVEMLVLLLWCLQSDNEIFVLCL